MTNNYDYDLTCPYCNRGGGYSDFPDFITDDMNNTDGEDEQYNLLKELWSKGFNIVTCGDCGQVFIHRTEE